MLREDFDRWLEEHYNELLAVARKRTNSQEDAEDVVQTALVTVLPRVASLQAPTPWKFFVGAIAGAAAHRRDSVARQRRVKAEVRAVEKINSPAAFFQGWKWPAARAD